LQAQAYRDDVLPAAVIARVTVKESSPAAWMAVPDPLGVVLREKLVGPSALINLVAKRCGFSVGRLADGAAVAIVRRRGARG
jgi:hypothetical protein